MTELGGDEFGTAESAAGMSGVYARHGKRILDVALGLVAAPVVAPLVAVLGLAVRLDGGPAFYGQERVGRGGRHFTCWKLRTMVPDADSRLEAYLDANPAARAEWDATQKLRDDPRVTRFGRFLRISSLDELPQLWNILKGEMSLVGPRPFTPDQRRFYHGASYYALRPGLTGYWQIGGRNDATFAQRAVDDARYAREIGLWTDLRTILKTVRVVFRGTGC
jgi:lipopolysaccharide/colanic/teichoic acid biosynthesis glycosyltransferase